MSLGAVKNLVSSMVNPLRNRVYNMITRAVLEAVNDSKKMQVVKIELLKGESRDEVERFQNFGFTSVPPVSAECVAVAVGGNTEHLIVIVADDRQSRLKNLAGGESAQYNEEGTFIHLKKGGKVIIKNADNEFIELNSETLKSIIGARVVTLLGPQPLLAQAPDQLFPALKTKVDTFKD